MVFIDHSRCCQHFALRDVRLRPVPGRCGHSLQLTGDCSEALCEVLSYHQNHIDDLMERLHSRATRDGRRNVPILAKFADDNDAHFFDCLDASERLTLR